MGVEIGIGHSNSSFLKINRRFRFEGYVDDHTILQ